MLSAPRGECAPSPRAGPRLMQSMGDSAQWCIQESTYKRAWVTVHSGVHKRAHTREHSTSCAQVESPACTATMFHPPGPLQPKEGKSKEACQQDMCAYFVTMFVTTVLSTQYFFNPPIQAPHCPLPANLSPLLLSSWPGSNHMLFLLFGARVNIAGPALPSACQLLSALAELMDLDPKTIKPWVNWNQPALERVGSEYGLEQGMEPVEGWQCISIVCGLGRWRSMHP